jgi:hypothetical protein
MKLNNIFLLIMMILFISCSNNTVQNDGMSKTNKIKDSINKQKVIDQQMAKGDQPNDEQETPTPAEERKKLINQYDRVETIDTTIVNGNDKLKLFVKYYCLKDSIIAVPKTYQFDEKKPQGFITHPFTSNILLTRNGDTVLNKQFKARDFNPFFQDNFGGNLKKYGSILMPELSRNNKDKTQIVLSYSIAIPATDIGKGMNVIISKNGKYRISEN